MLLGPRQGPRRGATVSRGEHPGLYSEIPEATFAWWERETSADWKRLRARVLEIFAEADDVEATARLVGSEGLPARQRLLLRLRLLLEDGFLLQSAFDETDAYCSPRRQHRLLRTLVSFADRALAAVERGASDRKIMDLPVVADLSRARSEIGEEDLDRLDLLEARAVGDVARLEAASAGSAA